MIIKWSCWVDTEGHDLLVLKMYRKHDTHMMIYISGVIQHKSILPGAAKNVR